MKLTIYPAFNLNYNSERWIVNGLKINLPSISPTTIPNVGYSGYGWFFKILVTPLDITKLSAELYKGEKLIDIFKAENNEYIIMPTGGKPDDYKIIFG